MILAIYCAGGLGREILEFACSYFPRWEEIVFVDDVSKCRYINDARVLYWEEVEQYRGNVEFLIANGEPAVRQALYEKIKAAGHPLTTLVSDGCAIARDVVIEEGAIIYDSILSVGTHIGANTLINGKIVLGHDTVIGKHCIFGSNVYISGGVVFDDCCYVGPGAMISDHIRVGADSIISMGSVVFRNVKKNAIIMGNPAQRIGMNTERRVFNRFEEN